MLKRITKQYVYSFFERKTIPRLIRRKELSQGWNQFLFLPWSQLIKYFLKGAFRALISLRFFTVLTLPNDVHPDGPRYYTSVIWARLSPPAHAQYAYTGRGVQPCYTCYQILWKILRCRWYLTIQILRKTQLLSVFVGEVERYPFAPNVSDTDNATRVGDAFVWWW